MRNLSHEKIIPFCFIPGRALFKAVKRELDERDLTIEQFCRDRKLDPSNTRKYLKGQRKFKRAAEVVYLVVSEVLGDGYAMD